MTNELTHQPQNELTHQAAQALAGQVANQAAAKGTFTDYQARKADNTNRRAAADLALFAAFLRSAGLTPGDLQTDPAAWHGITWGLVEAFTRWQLLEGYAVGSVNVRLATVKTYAGLALKAGEISPADYALIMTVKGYSHKETKRIDEKREASGQDTRKSTKKAAAVVLTPAQADDLLTRPDTPQGRRDALMLALMIDHGLRVGEVAILAVGDFDLARGELRFYRPKVDKTQTHKLTPRTQAAALAYIQNDAPALGPVWRASAGRGLSGELADQGMSERAITKRVAYLGALAGVAGLSAHDLRHYWATRAARNGTQIDRLQDAGGWNSPAMPLRYVEAAKIANSGVMLG